MDMANKTGWCVCVGGGAHVPAETQRPVLAALVSEAGGGRQRLHQKHVISDPGDRLHRGPAEVLVRHNVHCCVAGRADMQRDRINPKLKVGQVVLALVVGWRWGQPVRLRSTLLLAEVGLSDPEQRCPVVSAQRGLQGGRARRESAWSF